MDFGLGLVLTFTDNASVGLAGVATTIGGLSSTIQNSGSSLDALGNSLSSLTSLGAGLTTAITTPISTFMSKITQYGISRASFVEDTHLAFKSLMGDAQIASDYMQELMGFAKTTPYTYEGLTSAAQTLITYGIKENDILKKTKKGYEGILQSLGDWAGATGQGEAGLTNVADILGKISAEGKVSTIRVQQLQRAGLQASKMIGNMYNKTEAEAQEYIKTMSTDQFIADISKGIEEGTKGINGATGAMKGMMDDLKNTWTGAKDTFVSSMKTAGLTLMGEYKDKWGVTRYTFLDTMTESLNNVSYSIKLLSPLLQPLVTFIQNTMKRGSETLKKIADSISIVNKKTNKAELTAKGKILSRIVSALTMLGPALLIGGKLGGTLLKTFSSAKSSIFGLVKGLFSMRSSILSLGSTMGVLALLWKWDIGGIRTELTGLATNVQESFNTAKDAVSGDVDHMKAVLDNVDGGTFFGGLTIAITKVITLFQVLGDAWNDSTISEDLFQKAKYLGILPLVEAILDLKYRFEFFKKGFIDGWKEIGAKIKGVITFIKKNVKGTIFENFFNSITNFFQSISKGDTQAWYNFGKSFGKFAIGAFAFWKSFKLIGGALGIINKVKSVVPKGGLIPHIFGTKGKGDDPTKSGGSFLSNPAKVAKSMASIGIIIGSISIVILALGALSKLPYFKEFLSSGIDTMAKLSLSIIPLITLVAPLALITALMSRFNISPKDTLKGMANIAILLGGITLLITAIGAITSIPGFADFVSNGADTLKKVVETLGCFISIGGLGFLGFCAVAVILGAIPIHIVLLGIVAIAAVLAALTGIIVAFGALTQNDGFTDFIKTGGETLALLFNVLGKIAGSLIGGFAEGVTNSLPAIGKNLAQFGENIEPLFNAVANAPLQSLGDFATGLAILIGALTLEGITKFITGGIDLPSIGTQLSNFSENAKDFFDDVGNYNDKGLEKAPKVFKAISGIGQYDFKSGGIAQLFTGDTRIDLIGKQLKDFGPSGKDFFADAGSYNDKGLEKAPKVFKAISAIGQYDFKFGGLAQLFTGETRIDVIGEQLKDFGPHSTDFFKAVSGYSDKGIAKTPKVLKAISSIGQYDFKFGGLAQLFTGETRLDYIGEQLKAFAPNGTDFFKDVGGYSDKGIAKAPKVFKAVSAIGGLEFKTGGFFELFTGKTDMGALGNQLADFGQKIVPFYQSVNAIPQKAVDNGVKVVESVAGLSKFRSGGLLQALIGNIDLSALGDNLTKFGESSKKFFTSVQNVTGKAINNGIKVLNALGGVNQFRSGGLLGAIAGDIDLKKVGQNLSDFSRPARKFFKMSAKLKDNSFENVSKLFRSTQNAGGIVNIAQQSNGSLRSFGKELVSFIKSYKTFVSETKGVASGAKNVSSVSTAVEKLATASTNSASKLSTSMGTIKSSISSMKSSVCSNLDAVQSKFKNMKLSFPSFKIPKIEVTGGFDVKDKKNIKVPQFKLTWHETGGIFDSPSVIGVGENGAEAVMPLENNTQWISLLAHQLKEELIVAPQPNYLTSGPMTPDNPSTPSAPTSIDNSVTFAAGAIQITMKNGSDEEVERVARKIMEYIKRQKEIEGMLKYQTVGVDDE